MGSIKSCVGLLYEVQRKKITSLTISILRYLCQNPYLKKNIPIIIKYLIKFRRGRNTEIENEHFEEAGENESISYNNNNYPDEILPMDWESKTEKENFVTVKNILQNSDTINWDKNGHVSVGGVPTGGEI